MRRSGGLTPTEAVSGFSNPAVITIGLLFVLSSAIQKTGLLEYIVVTINKLLQSSRTIGMAAYYFTISIASSLINNTAIVAIFMPITIRLAHSYKVSPSKMLIPLSYAAILGGTLTLVGTSTNLLVNSIYMGYEGAEPLGMFEFFKYGIFILIIGTAYLLFIAPKLIPSRTSTSSLTKSYHLGGYLTEMKVRKGSVLIGKSCIDRSINQNYDVTVLDIIRDQKHIANNIRQTILKENDILFVRGTLENFIRMKEVEGVTLLTDEKLTQSELEQEDNELVECLLTDDSELVGKSLMSTNFRQIFGAFILAIRRYLEESKSENVEDIANRLISSVIDVVYSDEEPVGIEITTTLPELSDDYTPPEIDIESFTGKQTDLVEAHIRKTLDELTPEAPSVIDVHDRDKHLVAKMNRIVKQDHAKAAEILTELDMGIDEKFAFSDSEVNQNAGRLIELESMLLDLANRTSDASLEGLIDIADELRGLENQLVSLDPERDPLPEFIGDDLDSYTPDDEWNIDSTDVSAESLIDANSIPLTPIARVLEPHPEGLMQTSTITPVSPVLDGEEE